MDNLNRRRNLGFFFDPPIACAPHNVALIHLSGRPEAPATVADLVIDVAGERPVAA